MPNILNDEILTQKGIRAYIQFGGAQPSNPVAFSGQDAEYMAIEAVKFPDGQGKLTPVWVVDPTRIGRYRLVSRKMDPPDLASATLKFYEKHNALPRHLQKINCPFNLYENYGACKDLSDYIAGWTDYVMVYSTALVDGPKDLGNRTGFDKDETIIDSIPLKLADAYPIGAMSFGDNAQTIITLEVIDAVYGSIEQCGACQPPDDGTKRIYAITKSTGSTPGTAPRLIYSVDGGVNWVQAAITGIGDIEDPVSVDMVGNNIMVTTRTAGGATTGGYYYAPLNYFTGVPGTWTKVTAGFVSGWQPYDVFVLSPREIFFSADGGTIYKSTDITAGVDWSLQPGTVVNTALLRIHGQDETIVAVGGSGTVVVSYNRGKNWGTAISAPVVATLGAVWVVDDNLWWVGTNSGTLWYTLNTGNSWTQKRFSGDSAGVVRDIVGVNNEVLFFSHDTATPTGRIFSTWNGGRDWTNINPRINNIPTSYRFNRLKVPVVDNTGISANTLVAAGLSGGGTDGVLLQGIVSRI
ncbi:MAG TPA: hypothetical protein VMQ76_07970 [Terracidiphilus sp.]|nr:hypothetical protein [Terracidiphilus sp.]